MNLTDEQKRIQETAAYGLPPQQRPLELNNLTHAQIEGLRQVVFQHDAQNAAMTRGFDLNKPPTPPYRYQEYPRMLRLAQDGTNGNKRRIRVCSRSRRRAPAVKELSLCHLQHCAHARGRRGWQRA